jgi:hypothetical protein
MRTYFILESECLKHLLKSLYQCHPSVQLWNLNNVQEKCQHCPFILKVHSPSHES